MGSFRKIILVLCVFLAVGCSATKSKSTPDADSVSQAQTKLSPEEIAKLTQPSEGHKVLQPLVGKWKAKSKFWMDPTGKPEESTATVSRSWILGKRFIREEYVDRSKKAPFSGIGTLGYDNVKKEYVSGWVDTMTTGIMTTTGKVDASGKVITFSGEQSCPMSGASKEFHSQISIDGPNSNTFKMFTVGKDGKEIPVVEIEFKRVKG